MKVRSLFEENFRKGHEANAQLCIYVDGEIVVDLYGTAIGDENYGLDTLAVGQYKSSNIIHEHNVIDAFISSLYRIIDFVFT